jgi:hypothetical protein
VRSTLSRFIAWEKPNSDGPRAETGAPAQSAYITIIPDGDRVGHVCCEDPWTTTPWFPKGLRGICRFVPQNAPIAIS